MKELWVQSLGASDSNVSDLGVKIPAGKTVDVFKYNPYLTEAQVKKSLESGALSRYIESGRVRIVQKQVTERPKTVDQIKQSNQTVKAKKTKSSVVIEMDTEEPEEGEGFEFADYGVNDIISHKKEGDAVVVTAKQDEDEPEETGVKLEPKEETGYSKQTQIVMDTAEKATDPTGPLAETATNQSQPFVVVKGDQKPPVKEEPEKEAEKPEVMVGDKGQVIVGEQEKPRSILSVKKAQEEDADPYSLPDDDEAGADKAIELEKEDTGMRVATKTKDGAIVIELKEDEEVPEEPKVVSKEKRSSSSKKK